MKIFLICAFLCMAHGANIQRMARNTEAIIPTIVEEILKVELQSDLKKNSAVEAFESLPIVKPIEEGITVEPVASRTIVEGTAQIEENKPEIVEIIAIQEIIPEPTPAISKSETQPEIVEVAAIKENIAKPIDNFRTESVPSAEQPMVEIIKETVIVEPVAELRQEPAAEVAIKEEEIVRPIVRNVVKEEIPQVEALRNIEAPEIIAVKEVVPEPVASSNIVEPVVEIVPQVKTAVSETVVQDVNDRKVELPAPILPELKANLEVKPMSDIVIVEVEVISEPKVEVPQLKLIPVVPEVKEDKVEAPVVAEVKKVLETMPLTEIKTEPEAIPMIKDVAIPSGEETDPNSRQSERPTIVQQIQQAAVNVVSNVPIVGQIFNRNPEVVTGGETVADESATTTAPGPLQLLQTGFQQVVANSQQFLQSLNPAASNTANTDGSDATPRPPGPIVQALQSAFQNVNNIINPANRDPTSTAAPASDEKEGVKPLKADEATKSVEPEPIEAVAPGVVQSEASKTRKVVEEEKDNLVKN